MSDNMDFFWEDEYEDDDICGDVDCWCMNDDDPSFEFFDGGMY